MLFFLAVIISVSVWLLWAIYKRNNSLSVFPEPPSKLFIGHALDVNSITKVLSVLTRYFSVHGKIVKVRLEPAILPLREIILTVDYKLVQFLLSKNHMMTKSENYKYLEPWLGKGLLLSDGSYWRKHRKILTPAFHFEILKEFVETFESVGDVLVDKLEKYEGVLDSIDIDPLVTLYTLDEMLRIVTDRCLSPIKLYLATYWLTKDFYIQRKAVEILHNFTSRVIKSKKGKKVNTEKKKMAFLDLLLKFSQNGQVLNDDEIREEVDTFMFEGHDTSAAGICFTLYCLANHAEIQEKVVQEQKNLFGNEKNPPIAYSELQSMKYLELVIKESLRLYPPVPIMGRRATEDIEFEGHILPKNTNIVICIYGMHRTPEYFPDPEKFIPERFENDDTSLLYAYIPFSAGSRNCIGQKFAMLEMKSIISKIVRHFELRPASPQHRLKLSAEIVLKSVNGVRVGLQKRT